jgi:acetolactate synthase-1/2/3 large subunit
MLDLSRPDLGFATIAEGHGMRAERVTTAGQFHAGFERALSEPGPPLIEAVL